MSAEDGTGPLRLVLCDDHRILGEALGAALQARGYQVLAITTTTADGLAAVAAHQPDVCVLDLYFPGQPGGLEAARAIRARHPGTRVLLLSGIADGATLAAAIQIGLAGCIRKDQTVEAIAEALEKVAAGGTVLDPGLRNGAGQAAASRPRCRGYGLTPREGEILGRIADGQRTPQMALAMNIATSTVQGYVKNVLAKLGAHSRLQVAAIARREGLVGGLPSDMPVVSCRTGERLGQMTEEYPLADVGRTTPGWGLRTQGRGPG